MRDQLADLWYDLSHAVRRRFRRGRTMTSSEYWSRAEHYRDELRAYEEDGERQARELSEFWDELDPTEKMAALNAIESRPRPRSPFRD